MGVSGNTDERFDAPEGDFCRNPESKIVADRWDRQRESCSQSNIWRPINRSPRREANGSDARGRTGFARPVRRRAGPMSPHRAARFSCRIDQIRQRRGHGDYSNSL